MALNFLSASRDPTVFDDPERFDPTRAPDRHIAFGIGPHMCLGMSLAKLHMRLTLERFLGPPAWALPPNRSRRAGANSGSLV